MPSDLKRSRNNSSEMTRERSVLSELQTKEQLSQSQPTYVITQCKHVPDTKWVEIEEQIEAKKSNLTGIVFLNPNFARTYYVPTNSFRCNYEDYTEYSNISSELLTLMKNGRYDNWMQAMIRIDSFFVSIHVCSAVLLLDKISSRCPNQTRISFHYYYLDDNLISYLVRCMPNVVSINLQNSIGLSPKAYGCFGMLPRLAHLNLSGTDLSENNLYKLLDGCHHLESLNISNNCAITGFCLSHAQVKHLKRLDIHDCWGITSKRIIEMVFGGMPNLLELLCNSGINNESLTKISGNCPNLIHLDISFEEFSYNDDSGYNLLSDSGFSSIANLTNLRLLRLRHIGKLTDNALSNILKSCSNLSELTLNLRHRHKLTDNALNEIGQHCLNLKYFESVHNHFIGKRCLENLSDLTKSLKCLVLRGNEMLLDTDTCALVKKCPNLRLLSLDGCKEVSDLTFMACILHARNIPADSEGYKAEFVVGLVCTAVDRSSLTDMLAELPSNLRIRASNQRYNKVHYNEFDGRKISELSLRDTFFPFYWYDFN